MATLDSSFRWRFPTTQWSLIQQGSSALPQVYEYYTPAIRGHLIRRFGFHRADADDIIQSFFLSQLLEKDFLAKPDPSRGRFRSFLLTAVDHFVLNYMRQIRAKKQRPQAGATTGLPDLPIDTDAHSSVDPFEVEWARMLVSRTVAEMREKCLKGRRPDIWGIFTARILRPIFRHKRPISYDTLSRHLGLSSPGQAANLLITGKRKFIQILRMIVREYAGSESEIDAEIEDLIRILSSSRA